MIKRVYPLVTLGLMACALTASALDQPTVKGGFAYVPDEYLLLDRFLSWSFAVTPSPSPLALSTRHPSAQEDKVIARAHALLIARGAKAIALLDGQTVVYTEYRAPATESSLFWGASMSKTVTAMAVGQALCEGKLTLEDQVKKWLPELDGKALGAATVRDLLRMSSGAVEPSDDFLPSSSGNMMTTQDVKDWATGTFDYLVFLSRDSISRAQHGMFSEYKPGERFAYKNTDPVTLGVLINRATGMSYAEWVQKTILDPMGTARPGQIAQDIKKQAMADGGIRLRMDDWIRFAWWVKQASRGEGCLADYIRQAIHTQIATKASRAAVKSGHGFAGYGCLIWTDNEFAPGTFWAAGFGGQRIGWNYRNDRMVVVFSNNADWMPDLYTLYKEWASAEQ